MSPIFSRLCLPLLAASLCGVAASARAATLNVPAQYTTIQAAINASQAGDTVLIADGTYQGTGNVNLDFGGKAITVASQNGSAKTIIDCQSAFLTQGVIFQSGETQASKLQGVTIENASYPVGAGISISSSSPTISNCLLLKDNAGPSGKGGGLYVVQGSPLVIGCGFQSDTAGEGAGADVDSDLGSFVNCTFTGNGIKPVAINPVSTTGGGLYIHGLPGLSITGCAFSGNLATTGAGISTNGPVTINNSTFTGNSAGMQGGGIAVAATGAITSVNCTFTANTAPTGAGLFIAATGGSIVTNTILYGDNGGEIVGSGATVSYSDVQGGFTGLGNLNANSVFANAPGDLHLRSGSPCLRTGTATGAPTTDKDGVVRPVPPSIGAYEGEPSHLLDNADSYVLSSAPTQNFGTVPTLLVGGYLGAAYLRFDLSGLGALSSTSTVKLLVNAGRAQTGAASLIVSATGSNWTEAGITFQNRPAVGLPLGFLNVSADGLTTAPYDVDITSYVKAQQALGTNQLGLVLTQFSAGLPVSVDSFENRAGDGPQLVVTY